LCPRSCILRDRTISNILTLLAWWKSSQF